MRISDWSSDVCSSDLGRPISDGFAIIRPYKSGQGLKVEVEQSQGSYQARSGTFGPALYPQIGSYSPRTLVYDVPNASAGLDIGTGSLRVLPPYRTGYVVRDRKSTRLNSSH